MCRYKLTKYNMKRVWDMFELVHEPHVLDMIPDDGLTVHEALKLPMSIRNRVLAVVYGGGLSLFQLQKAAILCAGLVYKDPVWHAWAEDWVSGVDTSSLTAETVRLNMKDPGDESMFTAAVHACLCTFIKKDIHVSVFYAIYFSWTSLLASLSRENVSEIRGIIGELIIQRDVCRAIERAYSEG